MSVTAKAERLARSGAVEILQQTDTIVVADVEGDTGSHRVTATRDGLYRGCTCRSVAPCSHLEALALVLKGEPMPSEPSEAVQTTDVEEQSRQEPASDVTPTSADLTPALAVEAALLPVANTPVSYSTLRMIAKTEFVPASLRGRPDAVLAAVLFGKELGLGPMESLAHVDVIDGRPSPSAELLSRLIRSAGHLIEILEHSDQVCRIKGTRIDTGEKLEIAYSLEDAERAGLVRLEDGTPRARSQRGSVMPWEAYTADLLWARAITRLHRRLFSDITRLEATHV